MTVDLKGWQIISFREEKKTKQQNPPPARDLKVLMDQIAIILLGYKF